jgi:hypothetical protein
MFLPFGPITTGLVDRDLYRDDTRRVPGEIATRGGQRLVHLAEDVQASFLGLRQRLFHDLEVEPLDLDIHLDGRDAILGASDLEIHVTEMVFGTEDIRQNRVLLAFLDETHRHAGDGRFHGHTGIEQRERSATHRRHRR